MSIDALLLNPEEVAAHLQVSEYTALKWLRQGRIKGRELGRFWRVKAEDVEAFINRPPDTEAGGPVPRPDRPHERHPDPRPTDAFGGDAAAVWSPCGAIAAQGSPAPAPVSAARRGAEHPQAISHRLNAEGVPTLSGRGAWQWGTVANLLVEAKENV